MGFQMSIENWSSAVDYLLQRDTRAHIDRERSHPPHMAQLLQHEAITGIWSRCVACPTNTGLNLAGY